MTGYVFTEDVNSVDFVPHHKRKGHIMSTRTDSRIVADFDAAILAQPQIDDYLSFFTGKTIGAVLVDVFFGLSIEKALKRANVPFNIFIQWKSHAIRSDGLIRRFFLTLDKAQIDFELTHVKNLSLQSTVDAKTSLLLLERTRSDYAPRSFVQVSTLEGGYIDDLKQLVSSGAMTVTNIIEEVGELDDIQITMLYGVERRRILALESADSKSIGKYLV